MENDIGRLSSIIKPRKQLASAAFTPRVHTPLSYNLTTLTQPLYFRLCLTVLSTENDIGRRSSIIKPRKPGLSWIYPQSSHTSVLLPDDPNAASILTVHPQSTKETECLDVRAPVIKTGTCLALCDMGGHVGDVRYYKPTPVGPVVAGFKKRVYPPG
jgi:hypothetical protein